MDINPDDSDAVFRLRHEAKVNTDALGALTALDLLRARHGETAPLAFNSGLCLFELGDLPAAHAAFRTALTAQNAPVTLGALIVDSAELFLKTVGATPADAIDLILPVARYFNVDQRARFLTYLLSKDSSRSTFDLFWAVFEVSSLAAFTSPPAADVVRQLYMRCSVHGEEDRFAAVFSDPRLSSLRDSDDLTLIGLIHECDQAPERWLTNVRDVLRRGVINSRDAADLALIAISLLDDDKARPILEALAAQNERNWGVMRIIGVMAERSGRLAEAMEAYDRAARCELKVRGIGIPKYAAAAGAPLRISGIALSFNDAPLVPHFCRMIAAHCDELVVNDGGSTDDTIVAFRNYSAETGFPIHVIEDIQHGNRDRTIFSKEGYRERNLGGVLGFDADRRRTTTVVQAEGQFLLMLDLDDYLPPFPNMRTLVQASPYVDHFAGARLEVIGNGNYTALHLGPNQACPTLYRRHRKHIYAGVDGGDEYLSRLDKGIARWAMAEPHLFLTDCYNYWHLKHVLDGRTLPLVRCNMGPSYRIKNRWDRPLSSALPARIKM